MFGETVTQAQGSEKVLAEARFVFGVSGTNSSTFSFTPGMTLRQVLELGEAAGISRSAIEGSRLSLMSVSDDGSRIVRLATPTHDEVIEEDTTIIATRSQTNG